MMLLLLLSLAQATDYTLCASGCDDTLTKANIEAYFSSASCGDTIKLGAGETLTLTAALGGPLVLNKNCTAGSPITLTTTKDTWLPDNSMRITPSYSLLLPLIYRPATEAFSSAGPVLESRRSTGAVKGIVFRGLELRSQPRTATETASYTNFAMLVGDEGITDLSASNSSDVRIEHNLFSSSSKTAQGLIGGCLNVTGNNMQMVGNWCDDIRIPNSLTGQQSESYGLLSRNGGSGYLFRNNMLNGCFSEGLIIGADGPASQKNQTVSNDWVVEHNYFNKPKKCYPGTADYWGFQSVLKNFFECKSCANFRAQFNGGNRSYDQTVGSQWYAVTMTTRVGISQPGYLLGTPHPLRVALDGPKTTVTVQYDAGGETWTNCTDVACAWVYNPVWTIGGGIAICTITGASCNIYTEMEARTITAVTNQWTFTVGTAFVNAITTGASFAVLAPFNKIENALIANNFLKNTAQDLNYAGCDTAQTQSCLNGVGGSSTGLRYINNLTVADEPEYMDCCGMTISTLNVAYLQALVNYSPSVVRIEHNTRYNRVSGGANVETGGGPGFTRDAAGRLKLGTTTQKTGESSPALVSEFQHRNNLFAPREYGQLTVSDVNTWSANNANSKLLFDAAPESGLTTTNMAPCSGSRHCETASAIVQSTFDPKFVSESGNDYGLRSDSVYRAAGYGGADVGVNMSMIPAIQYLKVTPSQYHITFAWRLTAALESQTCQIEVSPDSGLVTSLGTYTVVNAIRPDFFTRGDADRYNSRATGWATAKRTFQVGANTSENDDNSISRNLALTPNTLYYYRLMCGGAMETGSVTTLP